MSRAAQALAILRRMNEARRIGQGFAAEMLEEQLEDIDAAGGYSRTISPDDRDVLKPGEKGRGGKRRRDPKLSPR